MEQTFPAFIKKYAEEVDNIEEMRREFKKIISSDINTICDEFEKVSNGFLDIETFDLIKISKDSKLTSDYIDKYAAIKLRKHHRGRRSQFSAYLGVFIGVYDPSGNLPPIEEGNPSQFYFYVSIINNEAAPWAEDFDEAVFSVAQQKDWFDNCYTIKDDMAILIWKPLAQCSQESINKDIINVRSLLKDDWEQIVSKMSIKDEFKDWETKQLEDEDITLQKEDKD